MFQYIGAGLLILLLQMTLANWIRVAGIKPDFIMLFIIYVGYREGKVPGILFGFGFGLLQDLVAASAFIGISSLIKSILGFGAGFLQRKFHVINPFILYAIVVLLILLGNLIYYGIYYAGAPISFGLMLQRLVLPSFIYTLVVGSLLLFVIPVDVEHL
ncbi:MAG: rod shape-determining protein MreD [Candidatus Marinimicrobia bacterium]|nr:rod shape-determining protein MreD [Candidatus Neomarinimicrobiota bacterium]